MLHSPGADGFEGTGEAGVAGEFAAADGIDDDAGAVRRVLDAEAQLEVHRDATEAGAFEAEEADFVVFLEGDKIAGADVDLVRVERDVELALDRLGFADLFAREAI